MKHAYLIMAHNEFGILEKIIKLIDDERNDLFIHIDKKVKDFDFKKFGEIPKKSKIYFTKRIDVRWGTESQIACEYIVLKHATSTNKYAYYHLLSGMDIPLVNQDTIHSFFDKHQGKEFVHFFSHHSIKDNRLERIKYYHFFIKNLRSKNKLKMKIAHKLHRLSLKIEKKLKINRTKGKDYWYGANWFSITDDLARYVVSLEKSIKKEFKTTFCADELFLQTIVYRSDFHKNLYKKADDDYEQIKRCIDWKRGKPYVYRLADYDELMNSKQFFARKLNKKDSTDLINKIYKKLMHKKKNNKLN